jgi:hypothetical protein
MLIEHHLNNRVVWGFGRVAASAAIDDNVDLSHAGLQEKPGPWRANLEHDGRAIIG